MKKIGRPVVTKCVGCGGKRDMELAVALCRPCRLESQRDFMRKHPWYKTHIHIMERCTYGEKTCSTYASYGGRGIKNFLTIKDLEYLWHRDKAWRLERPSIDRINSNGHYTVRNCRYIELSENISRGAKGRRRRTK